MKPLKRITRFVVIYDVCVVDDTYYEMRNAAKRRTKLSRILFEFGVRTQRSVFEVEVSGENYLQLIDRLKRAIRETTDKVYLYPLDSGSVRKTLRLGRIPEGLEDIFL